MFTIVNLACKTKTFNSFDELLKTCYNLLDNDYEYKIVHKDIDIFIEKHQEKVSRNTYFKGYYIKSKKGYYKDIEGNRFRIQNILKNSSYIRDYIVFDKNIIYNITL
jgi:hypothetical protein